MNKASNCEGKSCLSVFLKWDFLLSALLKAFNSQMKGFRPPPAPCEWSRRLFDGEREMVWTECKMERTNKPLSFMGLSSSAYTLHKGLCGVFYVCLTFRRLDIQAITLSVKLQYPMWPSLWQFNNWRQGKVKTLRFLLVISSEWRGEEEEHCAHVSLQVAARSAFPEVSHLHKTLWYWEPFLNNDKCDYSEDF